MVTRAWLRPIVRCGVSQFSLPRMYAMFDICAPPCTVHRVLTAAVRHLYTLRPCASRSLVTPFAPHSPISCIHRFIALTSLPRPSLSPPHYISPLLFSPDNRPSAENAASPGSHCAEQDVTFTNFVRREGSGMCGQMENVADTFTSSGRLLASLPAVASNHVLELGPGQTPHVAAAFSLCGARSVVGLDVVANLDNETAGLTSVSPSSQTLSMGGRAIPFAPRCGLPPRPCAPSSAGP